MKGSVKITVTTKKLKYELNLRRNITIIQGDSATGKTTLIQIISDYLAQRTGPGTEVVCDKPCAVLSGDAESSILRLKALHNSVVFVDEQERFLNSKAFAEAVLASDCYFVFVTRDGLHMLPYSVKEIYCLRNSGYYQNTKQIFNSMHQIYLEENKMELMGDFLVLTEDSNAGYEVYRCIFNEKKILCDTANGKSNVAEYILKNKDKPICAIVDGAAFGADMRSAMHAVNINHNSCIWAPESFEYVLLESGIVHANGLEDILEKPEDYIESGRFISWERYFTWLLGGITKDTIYEYKKNRINKNYLTKGNLKKIEQRIPLL